MDPEVSALIGYWAERIKKLERQLEQVRERLDRLEAKSIRVTYPKAKRG